MRLGLNAWIATFATLAGWSVLVAAAWYVHTALGMAVLGLALLLLGHAAADVHKRTTEHKQVDQAVRSMSALQKEMRDNLKRVE